ncbi:IclR family transcriptional regulator [Leucobacter sp. USHLN153]|uniref:IclR family transcriptional regulator n=1 Tax=Leucobacter sp. USHLN153 TaxID=3081268 RepID=UPI0030165CE1
MTTTAPTYPIESVDRTLRLLTIFANGKALTVSAVAEELGVARSTAHRLLAMLEHHGYVRQDPLSKVYGVGAQTLRVGLAAVRDLDIRGVARPHLEALRDQFEETPHLTVLDGGTALVVDSLESRQPVRVGSRVGIEMSLWSTASGRALLAGQTAEFVERHVPEHFEALHPDAIGSRAEMLGLLKLVRQQGYATSFGEFETDLASIAVVIPIPSTLGNFAVSLSAPTSRMPLDRVPQVVEALQGHAASIASEVLPDAVE